MNRFLLITILLLAGCVQLPPLPGDATAKRFEPVADRAVIYIARHRLDRDFLAPVMLDDEMIGSTYQGTYMRLVVPGGTHRITGYAGDSGAIQLQTVPGNIYFINHTTSGKSSLSLSFFDLVDAKYGQFVVLGGTLTSEFIR